MKKNWFILYTKSGTEKRMVSSLEKKGHESYFPLCYKAMGNSTNRKHVRVPLFDGYIFVKTTKEEIAKVRTQAGALNVVYWKNVPAEVPEAEMELMRNFIDTQKDIVIRRTGIIDNDYAGSQNLSFVTIRKEISFSADGYTQVILPSLGCMLIAKTDTAKDLPLIPKNIGIDKPSLFNNGLN